jgi:hypothetical protein
MRMKMFLMRCLSRVVRDRASVDQEILMLSILIATRRRLVKYPTAVVLVVVVAATRRKRALPSSYATQLRLPTLSSGRKCQRHGKRLSNRHPAVPPQPSSPE